MRTGAHATMGWDGGQGEQMTRRLQILDFGFWIVTSFFIFYPFASFVFRLHVAQLTTDNRQPTMYGSGRMSGTFILDTKVCDGAELRSWDRPR